LAPAPKRESALGSRRECSWCSLWAGTAGDDAAERPAEPYRMTGRHRRTSLSRQVNTTSNRNRVHSTRPRGKATVRTRRPETMLTLPIRPASSIIRRRRIPRWRTGRSSSRRILPPRLSRSSSFYFIFFHPNKFLGVCLPFDVSFFFFLRLFNCSS
jgi:hypothetical protein